MKGRKQKKYKSKINIKKKQEESAHTAGLIAVGEGETCGALFELCKVAADNILILWLVKKMRQEVVENGKVILAVRY